MIFDNARVKQPKLFYKAMIQVMKMKKSGVTVIAFKDKTDPTKIKPPMSFVEEHFNNSNMPVPDEVNRPNHTTTITMEDL